MVEAEARQWFIDIAAVIRKGMLLTDNTVDDRIAVMFESAIASPMLWQYLWPLIDGMFEDSDKLQSSVAFDSEAAKVGIDPLTILAIVKAAIELIKMFRR